MVVYTHVLVRVAASSYEIQRAYSKQMCIFLIPNNVTNTECNIKPHKIFTLDFVFLWSKFDEGTEYLDGGTLVRFPAAARNVLFSKASRPALGTTCLLPMDSPLTSS
jgi:hypothetical protein